jgi:hypothetical protein
MKGPRKTSVLFVHNALRLSHNALVQLLIVV